MILTLLVERTVKPAVVRENDKRMKVIPGFDHWSKPLPGGLRHEDIIRRYPNHLRGELLLEITATMKLTLVDISRMSGQEQLSANLLGERKRAAEKKRDGLPVRATRSKKALKTATRPEPVTRPVTVTSPEPVTPPEPVTTFVQHSQTDNTDTLPESECENARIFRNQQEGILAVALERDPTYALYFASPGKRRWSKKQREWYEELHRWATQEYGEREKIRIMAEGNGQRTSSWAGQKMLKAPIPAEVARAPLYTGGGRGRVSHTFSRHSSVVTKSTFVSWKGKARDRPPLC